MTKTTEPTSGTILTGWEALDYADWCGISPNKYADPTEDARTEIPILEAYEIAKVDPRLIWVKVPVDPDLGDIPPGVGV